MEQIFKGKSCQAEYNSDKNRIVYTFNGYAEVEEHKSMYLKAFGFMKNNKTTSFIMDFRQMKGTFTMLNDWAIETFRPAVEMGLSKCAMILNNDIFTAFASNDAINKVRLIQIQVFKEFKEAEAWCDK